MKMKHSKILTLSLAAAALCGAMMISACGEGDTTGTGGSTGGSDIFVMEAEYIDLSNVHGAGISSDQQGVQMIYGKGTDAEKQRGWSSGYYLGYTYSASIKLNFVFESDRDATGTVILRLGSELGSSISLDPSIFSVSINGEEVGYNAMYIESSLMEEMRFYDKTVTTNATIKKGSNTITLSVLPNDLKMGQTGGPMVDCVKVQTDAVLSWTAKTDNIAARDGGGLF